MNANLSNYVFTAKYARYLTSEKRRETYIESVNRMLSNHPNMIDESMRKALYNKEIAGSQRALQFGGDAITEKNARLYNCCVSYCDRIAFFKETFYLLLCGCGVGFSVQKHHVDRLPSLYKGASTVPYLVEDSIEGWCDALHALLKHYFYNSPKPEFDYSAIRPYGAKLRHGGKAPSYKPLKKCLDKISAVLDGANHKLKPIEAFDITMYIADAVISGGIRRSATIAIFSVDDEEMMNAKTGDWFVSNPQRGRANISAMITDSTPVADFNKLFKSTKEFGEPAFIFSKSREYINNPCVEITMCPTLIKYKGEIVENYTIDMLENQAYYKLQGYTFETGFQMCNLTTINASKQETAQDFYMSVAHATKLGTLQARFIDFKYLGSATRDIVKRESLLGVSITGILANREVLTDDVLAIGAELAVQINKEVAESIGIPQASRITCVKPEGTASIVLGTCAGIHPYYAPKFIRRVQAVENEEVYKFYERMNPTHCLKSVWGDESARVIEFACEAPSNAVYIDSAIEHLEIARQVNINWVRAGTALPDRLEDAHHNVSITVTVRADEWDDVRNYLWENRKYFTGVSLLADVGAMIYEQAPYEQVFDDISEDDEFYEKKIATRDRYYHLLTSEKPVNYTDLIETEDNTAVIETIACGANGCDL